MRLEPFDLLDSVFLENFSVNLGEGIKPEIIAISRGDFLMVSPDSEEGRFENEEPHHQVTFPNLWMGKYTVMQAQWRVVFGRRLGNNSIFTCTR